MESPDLAETTEARTQIDVKYVERPTVFNGEAEMWRDWKFKFVNWVGVVDYRLPSLLRWAEMASSVPCQTGDILHQQVLLYTILASHLVERTTELRILQAVADSNGFEAWRMCVAEHEPKVAVRRLALLGGCCHHRYMTSPRCWTNS